MNFIYVALGGALGAMARYAISLMPVKTQFPILTLITNIFGANVFLSVSCCILGIVLGKKLAAIIG